MAAPVILFGITQLATTIRFAVSDTPVILKGFGLQSSDWVSFQEEVYPPTARPIIGPNGLVNPSAPPIAVKAYESACCTSPCMGPGCSPSQPDVFAISAPGYYVATFHGSLAAQVVTLIVAPLSMDVSELNGCCGQSSGGGGGGGSGDETAATLCQQLGNTSLASPATGDTMLARDIAGACKRIPVPTFAQTPFTFTPFAGNGLTATLSGTQQPGPNFLGQFAAQADPDAGNWLTVGPAGILVKPTCAMLLAAFPAHAGTVTHVWGTDAGGNCGLFLLPDGGGGPPSCDQLKAAMPTAVAAAALFFGIDIHGACGQFPAPTLNSWCAFTPAGSSGTDCSSTSYVDIDPNGGGSGICAPVLRQKMLPATVDSTVNDIAVVNLTNAQILAACTGGSVPTLSASIAYDSQNLLDASGRLMRQYTDHGPADTPSNYIFPFVVPLVAVQPGDMLVLMVNYCYVAPGDPADGYHSFSDTMTVATTLPLAGSGFTLAQESATFHQATNVTATPTEDVVKVFTANAAAAGSGTITLNAAVLVSGHENEGAIQTTLYLVRASDGSTVQLKRSDAFSNFDATGAVTETLPGSALVSGATDVLWLSGARQTDTPGYVATPSGVLNNAPGAASGGFISNAGAWNKHTSDTWNVSYNHTAGTISQQASGMAFEFGATGSLGGACPVTVFNGNLTLTNTNTCFNTREQVNERVSYLVTDAAMELPGLKPGVSVLLTQTLGSKVRKTRGVYLGTGIEWDGPLATIGGLFAGTLAPGATSATLTYTVQFEWDGPPPANNATVAAIIYPGRLTMRGDH